MGLRPIGLSQGRAGKEDGVETMQGRVRFHRVKLGLNGVRGERSSTVPVLRAGAGACRTTQAVFALFFRKRSRLRIKWIPELWLKFI